MIAKAVMIKTDLYNLQETIDQHKRARRAKIHGKVGVPAGVLMDEILDGLTIEHRRLSKDLGALIENLVAEEESFDLPLHTLLWQGQTLDDRRKELAEMNKFTSESEEWLKPAFSMLEDLVSVNFWKLVAGWPMFVRSRRGRQTNKTNMPHYQEQ